MGPVGLPRRNLGRFVSSFVSSEDWFAGALAGGASFCVDFFWSVVLSSFFASGLEVLGEDAGGLVEVGAAGVAAGFDPAGEGVVDVVEGAVELDVVSLFVKRGGASVVSIPLGTIPLSSRPLALRILPPTTRPSRA